MQKSRFSEEQTVVKVPGTVVMMLRPTLMLLGTWVSKRRHKVITTVPGTFTVPRCHPFDNSVPGTQPYPRDQSTQLDQSRRSPVSKPQEKRVQVLVQPVVPKSSQDRVVSHVLSMPTLPVLLS